jgi:hypothetical protein
MATKKKTIDIGNPRDAAQAIVALLDGTSGEDGEREDVIRYSFAGRARMWIENTDDGPVRHLINRHFRVKSWAFGALGTRTWRYPPRVAICADAADAADWTSVSPLAAAEALFKVSMPGGEWQEQAAIAVLLAADFDRLVRKEPPLHGSPYVNEAPAAAYCLGLDTACAVVFDGAGGRRAPGDRRRPAHGARAGDLLAAVCGRGAHRRRPLDLPPRRDVAAGAGNGC